MEKQLCPYCTAIMVDRGGTSSKGYQWCPHCERWVSPREYS